MVRVILRVAAALACGLVFYGSAADLTAAQQFQSTPAGPLPASKPTPRPPTALRPTHAEIRVFRQRLLKLALPPARTKGRCFVAQYPKPRWVETSCEPAPTAPFPVHKGANSPRPNTVGDGTDNFALAPQGANIVRAEGSFPVVDVKGETGVRNGDTSKWYPNTYSIQLNSNSFSSPACGSATNCRALVQFVYSASQCSSSKGCILIEDWLLDHPKPCPSGWSYYPGPGNPGCYINVSPTKLPLQSWADLQSFSMAASTGSSVDTLIVFTASGKAYASSHKSVTSLAQGWSTVEFNLVGDCCSTEANFFNGTSTLQIQIDLTNSASATASCAPFTSDFTAETNNLNLAGGCSVASNQISFTETGGVPVPIPPPPLTCAQLSADIAELEKIITQETAHPPPCPSGIFAICSQKLKADEATLAAMRADYAKRCRP